MNNLVRVNYYAFDKIAAKVVIESLDHEILLIKRAPHISFPGWWEFCGGSLDANESFESCVIRETREETGLRVSGLCPLGHFIVTDEAQKLLIAAYKATTRTKSIVLSGEHTDYMWTKLADIDTDLIIKSQRGMFEKYHELITRQAFV